MDISQLTAYTNRVINDGEITRDEAKELLTFNDEDTPLLLAMADKIRRFFRGNDVDCCAIVGGRSGRCPEACRFCAQSCHYNTGIKAYPLIDTDKMIEAAKKAKAAGATRFSIVTGGRAVEEGTDFNTILQAVPVIRNTVGIEVCCSLGFISENQLLALKKAGITRYHSNIETAPSYFKNICSTHTFADKEAMVKTVQKAGLRPCCGGIFGLGESLEQRLEMAFVLKNMGIDSIPINILNPVKGTPLEKAVPPSPWEILRIFAVFRFILPHAQIRTAGGREVNLRSMQAYALTAGADGLMIGGYLTTTGNKTHIDTQMLTDLGRKPAMPRFPRP